MINLNFEGREGTIVRKFICLLIIINFGLMSFMPEKSYCQSNSNLEQDDSIIEMDWDYLTHAYFKDRYIDTVSLHVLKNISKTKHRFIYRGFTITRPYGYIVENQQPEDSSAVGIGPVYMVRYEKNLTGKLSAAVDASSSFIVYDEAFPAGGRYYNFMWRIGPRFIYKIGESSSINFGYTFMHVSNGLKAHNPGYNAKGVSLNFETKF
ncbi:MAG: Lipid 3-O-deacylase-related protein [Firmicutes bacterium]|nr:Lipid 3-O-deacylase-related protein [Bacillota bacterium]